MAPKTKPKAKPGDVLLSVRVAPDLIDLLDREVARLEAARPGVKMNRSDAVRETLYRALRPSK